MSAATAPSFYGTVRLSGGCPVLTITSLIFLQSFAMNAASPAGNDLSKWATVDLGKRAVELTKKLDATDPDRSTFFAVTGTTVYRNEKEASIVGTAFPTNGDASAAGAHIEKRCLIVKNPTKGGTFVFDFYSNLGLSYLGSTTRTNSRGMRIPCSVYGEKTLTAEGARVKRELDEVEAELSKRVAQELQAIAKLERRNRQIEDSNYARKTEDEAEHTANFKRIKLLERRAASIVKGEVVGPFPEDDISDNQRLMAVRDGKLIQRRQLEAQRSGRERDIREARQQAERERQWDEAALREAEASPDKKSRGGWSAAAIRERLQDGGRHGDIAVFEKMIAEIDDKIAAIDGFLKSSGNVGVAAADDEPPIPLAPVRAASNRFPERVKSASTGARREAVPVSSGEDTPLAAPVSTLVSVQPRTPAEVAWEKGDWNAAFSVYSKNAETEDADAQVRLGRIYYDGLGRTSDFRLAEQWYRKAAERGSSEAKYRLGLLYSEDRKGAPWDLSVATQFFTEAAQTNADAAVKLGSIYWNGIGVQEDKPEARKWYQHGARLGSSEAADWLRTNR